MRRIFRTNQFKKDYRLAQAQGKNIKALRGVIDTLVRGENLPKKFKDHPLHGEWNDYRDCHIKGDWILIYRIEGDMLFLERMGSHSELFE